MRMLTERALQGQTKSQRKLSPRVPSVQVLIVLRVTCNSRSHPKSIVHRVLSDAATDFVAFAVVGLLHAGYRHTRTERLHRRGKTRAFTQREHITADLIIKYQ